MLTKKPGIHRWRTRALTAAAAGAILLAGAPMMAAHAAGVSAGTVTLNDGGDGFTNATEAHANKPTVTWAAASDVPAGTTATLWFAPTTTDVSPGGACGPWVGQSHTGAGWLTPACADLLPEGDFALNVKWISGADESSVVKEGSTLDRVVNAPAITPDATVHPLSSGLVVNGTGDADIASVTVHTPSKLAKAGVIGSGGAWSATYTSSFTAGKHQFTATAIDVAGNSSAVSAPQTIRFSASPAPSAPVVSSPASGADIAANVVFTGTAVPGSVVILTTPIGSPPVDTEIGRATASAATQTDPGGNWAIGVSGLGGGQRAFTFLATDNVDRVSADTVRNHFVDPVKPVIAITQQNSSFYASGDLTVKGNAIDNRGVVSRVVVQLKNVVTGQLAAPIDATLSLKTVAPVGDPEDVGYVPGYSYYEWTSTFTPPVGAWSGQVFAVDAAGNVSNAANMTTFVSAVPPSVS